MTNSSNNNTQSLQSPVIHQGQPSHESIRNLIAANFKPPVRPTPPSLPPSLNRHDLAHEHENQQPHPPNVNSNSSSSSSTSSSPYSPPYNRAKSNSISVGVLSRARIANKRVSFSNLASVIIHRFSYLLVHLMIQRMKFTATMNTKRKTT